MLSAPTPIFLLLSGGPRALGGPRDQSQAVCCGLRSAQLCWVEDEGACRGTLRSLWLPELPLLARQAGRCRPPAPVTGAPGPFPASQGVAAPPTARDAALGNPGTGGCGGTGFCPGQAPLPAFCPAGAPRGGPRAHQPLHLRAGASFRLGLGPAQKCSWGWLAPPVLSSLWPPAASADPGSPPLESPGPGGAVRL